MTSPPTGGGRPPGDSWTGRTASWRWTAALGTLRAVCGEKHAHKLPLYLGDRDVLGLIGKDEGVFNDVAVLIEARATAHSGPRFPGRRATDLRLTGSARRGPAASLSRGSIRSEARRRQRSRSLHS